VTAISSRKGKTCKPKAKKEQTASTKQFHYFTTMSHLSDEDDEFLYGTSEVDNKPSTQLGAKNGTFDSCPPKDKNYATFVYADILV
jgi:hypothetical protein